MAWREDVFFPAFERAGMMKQASVIYKDTADAVGPYAVAFARPDIDAQTGVKTSDFPMEYQHRDFPLLGEGDQVEIDRRLYLVREPPIVNGASGTGFFRVAKLTEVRGQC